MECLQCNKLISVGRADKKFCSELCKNEYHNAERLLENGETSRIMLALKQNRRILKLILGNRDEFYISKESLGKKGFDFDYHTHTIVSGQGNTFIFCFNYAYRMMEEGRLKLVKWKKE